ncbi:ArsC/Spx/MgsR family protein [Oceanicaulis sp. UBA2681]|uniref:ArsC/Spx/MgsR family protein n=1 Tax=Oceanicaulis sp. UBA2681 TaxID=1947007 RepID=UPI000EE5EEF8|nr:ArsC/Spx/MgsR family protein [Oceanicaulis sp. UBA2681]HCR66577.1 ArsC family transcriptional regulator [Oceanicaulis sp.]|tara:strand:- start:5906 stop:6250 length:345 start_codon:yes stop_codon:yes gene_type:complete
MITIFGLKNCDTCKKAVKALQANNVAYEFVDIRAEADLADRVPVWLEAVGAKALINSRSTTWRSLDEGQRGRADTDPAALLVENPTLIKRPVIEAGEAVRVGWSDVIEQGLTSR